ncbi:PucR family transcriptional regulator [Bifidobacterium saguinibicoloris]|uniref:PucR family transcriptional regulator n=1 Tax=Bifidobacterium saguinibicoloris TaxID=2834433 RepID=UPI001C56D5CE|nr:helix-turn-helix domain-containing protein [Bifidobacterium saguinibicoloris]MBW3081252.1 helix-turn-helix domain-containing protein [Bifidobacterium saguinibicoloris]
MSDFLGLLAGYGSDAPADGRDGTDGGKTHTNDRDARDLLTAVAFESLASGLDDARVASLLRVLGWDGDVPCFAVAGRPAVNAAGALAAVDAAVSDLGGSSPIRGVHDGVVAAVVRVEAAGSPEVACTAMADAFDVARTPLCLGPVRHGVSGAKATLGAALATVAAAPALVPAAPDGPSGAARRRRAAAPLRAEDALPERALLGDEDAKRELVDVVYASLAGGHGDNPDDPTMVTVSTFLASGGSLETTARTLNVHPNTVRYRLKRAADSTGWDATDPREAYVLTTAIALGRMRAA